MPCPKCNANFGYAYSFVERHFMSGNWGDPSSECSQDSEMLSCNATAKCLSCNARVPLEVARAATPNYQMETESGGVQVDAQDSKATTEIENGK